MYYQESSGKRWKKEGLRYLNGEEIRLACSSLKRHCLTAHFRPFAGWTDGGVTKYLLQLLLSQIIPAISMLGCIDQSYLG